MRSETKSEIARLTATVQSIPEFARKGYELNVLGGRTLMGTVESMKRPLWWKSYGSMVALFTFLFWVLVDFAVIWLLGSKYRSVFGWQVASTLCVLPFFIGAVIAIGLLTKSHKPSHEMDSCRKVFIDLEANLSALGFDSFMDLEYDMVHGRLRTLASDYFTIETRYGQACDNWRKLGLPRVSELARSYGDANRILVQAIDVASKFGFNFSRGELLRWVESDHARLEQLANPSQG